MAIARAGFASPIVAYLSRLRFPTLFLVACGLFVADLLFPDMIPLVDEVLLGLAAVLLGRIRKHPENPAAQRGI